jgi:hypothetical protein
MLLKVLREVTPVELLEDLPQGRQATVKQEASNVIASRSCEERSDEANLRGKQELHLRM